MLILLVVAYGAPTELKNHTLPCAKHRALLRS